MNSQKQSQALQKPLVPNIQNIIAIASGKGGVGKSSVAVNLALALQKLGKKTGILDADIYGPSQPWMLGNSTAQASSDNNRIHPVFCQGLASMSIGYLIQDKDSAMIWRGPMVSQALQQMIYGTLWPELEYLIVDLPPGTGDIHLTLTQKIPLQGAVIVTTPQEVALLDAKKALNMLQKMQIPLLGVIENMTAHQCSACGHRDPIFGEEGGARLAKLFRLPLLGQIPLTSEMRLHLDAGLPHLIMAEGNPMSAEFLKIAAALIQNIAIQNTAIQNSQKNQSQKNPVNHEKIPTKIEIQTEIQAKIQPKVQSKIQTEVL